MRTNKQVKWFRFFVFLFCLSLLACQSSQKTPTSYQKAEAFFDDEYEPLLKKLSKKMSAYNGLHNQFYLNATLISPDFKKSQLQLQSLYYQWTPKELNSKIQSSQVEMSQSTEVFTSFFSPHTEADDLTLRKKPWRFFLEVDGQKYEGTASHIKQNVLETQKLYPYHNRWSKAFVLKFPVTSIVKSSLANDKVKLILTGPIDAKSATF